MIKKYLGLVTLMTMVLMVIGCQLPRQKQLEQENNELRSAMKEKEELLAQAQAKSGKQTETIGVCQEKINSQQKRIDELETVRFEINKQLELAQIQLKKQTEESTRLSGIVANYQTQIKELNDQLGQARQAVQSLQNQIKGFTTETKTAPSAATTQPAGK